MSSHQPRDLSGTIAVYQPEHVVVRCYLDMETPPQDHTRGQINSVRRAGCSIGTYLWLYRNADPVATANEAVWLARDCGVEPPIMWVDLEPYVDGTLPTVESTLRCLRAIEAAGVRAGVYTGAWVINGYMGGTTALSGYPLWSAQYDRPPVSEPPLNIPLYGGWTEAHGHQWSGNPIDRSVFLSSVTG